MITEMLTYAMKNCKRDILGAREKCAENRFSPAVNRRVVGSSPTCGANFLQSRVTAITYQRLTWVPSVTALEDLFEQLPCSLIAHLIS